MKRKKTAILSLVLLCAGALLAWYTTVSGTVEENGQPSSPTVRPIPTALVTNSPRQLYRSFPGSVRANRRADMAFSIDGLLTDLQATEGSRVKKGSIVARLDQRDAKNSYEVARARYEIAKKDFDRSQVLMERTVIPQAEFDNSKTALDVAAAEMRIRKKGMDDTVLIAPFDGIVSKRYVENFQRIKAKDTIMSLKDISMIDIAIQVPERLIAHGGGGHFSQVRVRFDALPAEYFPAEIKEFSIQSDPLTRTYEVVVSLAPPKKLQILPGMTATVLAPTRTETALSPLSDIVIPLAAVVGGIDSSSHVWVIPTEGGSPVKTAVTIGTLTGSGIEILDGLEPGVEVAVAGVHSLTEDMLVRPARAGREGLDQ